MSEKPPHNLDAERAALGAILLKPSAWPALAAAVRVDDFFLPANREVFAAFAAADKRGMPLDLVTVADELRARRALPRLEGGEAYLARLAESVPTGENVGHYARIVRDAAIKRRLLAACAETVQAVERGELDSETLLQQASAAISKLSMRKAEELVSIGSVLPAVMAEITRRSDAPADKKITGIRTGIGALDELTCAFDPGDVVVIGAEAGAGKTSLAVQTGVELTIGSDEGACFCCNLEMTRYQIVERIVAHRARVSSYYIRKGTLNKDDWSSLYRANAELENARFYIEDSMTSVDEFELRLRACRARHPDRKFLAIFDFLQMADRGKDTKGRQVNRADEIGAIAQRLKQVARTLGVVMILVSAFNRGEDQKKTAPTRKNLRDSALIENAADFILLLWNPDDTADGEMQAILDKNRKGPTGTAKVLWRARHFLHADAMPEDQPAQVGLL